MKITVCGSMQFEQEMRQVAERLRALGYETAVPNSVEGHAYGEGGDLDEIADLKRGFIEEHFAKIDTSEAILVVNHDKKGIAGYIGGNTLMEVTYAFAHGLDIYTLYELPTGVSYASEIVALMPTVLHGDIDALDKCVQEMPVVYLSTLSPIKHTAVGKALRRVGIKVRTVGVKVASGVNEQPQTIEETYDGAMNRHKALKAEVGKVGANDYYATIESGLHPIHPNHNVFGCTVVVVEKMGQNPKVGIDVDIEVPKSFTDKVPSVYPDMGALVQQEYGAVLKDPYPYITGNRLTRANIIEDVIYRVAVQLSVTI